MLMLLYAAHRLLPDPWWLREAGLPPSIFSAVRSSGTGFFVTSDGWLLTNRHVAAGCSRVSVGNAELSGLRADKILYPANTQLDLAAIHVELRSPTFLRFAVTPWPPSASGSTIPSAEILKNLQSVIARDGRAVSIIGFPGTDHGGSPVRLAGEIAGATSSDKRHWFLTIKAPVRPGSSGSPVINARGDVVGIVFKGSTTLPAGASAALERKTLAALSISAEEALIVPAAQVDAFVRAAHPADRGQEASVPTNPDDAIIRVFCFR